MKWKLFYTDRNLIWWAIFFFRQWLLDMNYLKESPPNLDIILSDMLIVKICRLQTCKWKTEGWYYDLDLQNYIGMTVRFKHIGILICYKIFINGQSRCSCSKISYSLISANNMKNLRWRGISVNLLWLLSIQLTCIKKIFSVYVWGAIEVKRVSTLENCTIPEYIHNTTNTFRFFQILNCSQNFWRLNYQLFKCFVKVSPVSWCMHAWLRCWCNACCKFCKQSNRHDSFIGRWKHKRKNGYTGQNNNFPWPCYYFPRLVV